MPSDYMGICFKVTYGVHPVHLDGATTGHADHAFRWLVTASMVEKDVSLIWVEDESADDRLEALSMKKREDLEHSRVRSQNGVVCRHRITQNPCRTFCREYPSA